MLVKLEVIQDCESREDIETFSRNLAILLEGVGNNIRVSTEIVGEGVQRKPEAVVAPPAARPATAAATPAKPTPAPRGRPPKVAAGNGGKPVDTGLADDDPTDLAGPTDPDDEDALGLSAPSMTPHEALEQGLGIARDLYAGGHRGPVKEVQQKWGVAKFTDIPSTDGHKFLKTMMDLQGKLGLRV